MFFGGDAEFVVECVVPDCFHVVPVCYYAVFDWVGEFEDAALGLGFVAGYRGREFLVVEMDGEAYPM